MFSIEDFPFQGLYLLYREGETIQGIRPDPNLTDDEFKQAINLLKILTESQELDRKEGVLEEPIERPGCGCDTCTCDKAELENLDKIWGDE